MREDGWETGCGVSEIPRPIPSTRETRQMPQRKPTLPMASLREKLSALVLGCTFVELYLGGAAMLVMGLYLACGDRRAAIQQHQGLPYSHLSASMGSTFAARRAGM